MVLWPGAQLTQSGAPFQAEVSATQGMAGDKQVRAGSWRSGIWGQLGTSGAGEFKTLATSRAGSGGIYGGVQNA